MKRTPTTNAVRPRAPWSPILLLGLVFLIGCHHVPRHTTEIVSEGSAARVSVKAPVPEPIPDHHIVWSMSGEVGSTVHSIVGTVRMTRTADSVVVADTWLPLQFEDFIETVESKNARYQYTRPRRAQLDIYACPDRWAFRLGDGTTLRSDTFAGPLERAPAADLDGCQQHEVALGDWEPSNGHPVWRELMQQRPDWLVTAARVRVPDYLVVYHTEPYEPWLYRRSDGRALQALPPISKSNPSCIIDRWSPSEALIASCRGTRWPDGRIARSVYFMTLSEEMDEKLTWHEVDDGEPFPDGMWLVDGSSCPTEYRGCVRDGTTRRPIEWRGKHELLISSPYGRVDRSSVISRTYRRWYMAVHAPRRVTPCPRSKAGCMTRTGPTRLLITDLSSGKRRWVPVDGEKNLEDMEFGRSGFHPRWGLDGSIWATALKDGDDSLAALYVGDAARGLEQKTLPTGAAQVQFIDRYRGIAWSDGRLWWTIDGGDTWNEVSALPSSFSERNDVSCEERGCLFRGVWLDWVRDP